MQKQKQEVVVGKAAKPIPVMILGVLVGHKSYPMKKYLFVLLIVVGVVMFMYKDQVKKTVADDSSTFGIGELLLLLSLTMDGLTGAVQERIKSESSPSAYAMMLNTNMWYVSPLYYKIQNKIIFKNRSRPVAETWSKLPVVRAPETNLLTIRAVSRSTAFCIRPLIHPPNPNLLRWLSRLLGIKPLADTTIYRHNDSRIYIPHVDNLCSPFSTTSLTSTVAICNQPFLATKV
uniref:SFRICE_030805 n=1 Tax=Spodoptera frugiperda TaxID=7108 RepID=A0A2H1WXR3_SPOFR